MTRYFTTFILLYFALGVALISCEVLAPIYCETSSMGLESTSTVNFHLADVQYISCDSSSIESVTVLVSPNGLTDSLYCTIANGDALSMSHGVAMNGADEDQITFRIDSVAVDAGDTLMIDIHPLRFINAGYVSSDSIISNIRLVGPSGEYGSPLITIN